MALEISDDDLLALDEFALLPENAEQIGATGPLPAVSRIEDGPISLLKWGTSEPEVVFLHGGGQNAHTWDTVILGLGVPALDERHRTLEAVRAHRECGRLGESHVGNGPR